MSKLSMLVAGATGYVLGARAGRKRYEQIVFQAQRVWTNPKVQKVTSDAQDVVREKAPIVTEKFGETSKAAMGAVASKVGKSSEPEPSPVVTPPVEPIPPVLVTDEIVFDDVPPVIVDDAPVLVDDAPPVVVEDTSPNSDKAP